MRVYSHAEPLPGGIPDPQRGVMLTHGTFLPGEVTRRIFFYEILHAET